VVLATTGLIAGVLACGPSGSDAHVGARARPAAPKPEVSNPDAELAAAPARKRKERRTKRTVDPDGAPNLDGTRCAAFVPLLPATLDGWRAKAPAEGKDIDLGEGANIVLLRRGYFKNSTALDVEIVDTEGGKPLRDLFERTRDLERDGESAVIKAIRVHGHKALAQWNDDSNMARVTILVDGRYLVHVSMRPTDGVAGAIGLADKLDLETLGELSSDDQVAIH
jgi:hypothetical protein